MYDRKDAWHRLAKKEGYRSRAVYKLAQIAKTEKAVRPGDRVIDAGAAPGGWSQILLELVGANGKVAAIDLMPMDPFPGGNFRFWRKDISDPTLTGELLEFLGGRADVVLSDAAPNIAGNPSTDQARSADLVRAVFSLARGTLKEGGAFLAKIFTGTESEAVFAELKPFFREIRRIRPEATRKRSSELYFLGKGFKGS